jgi:Leu/Phe-tRNA-protein transferase
MEIERINLKQKVIQVSNELKKLQGDNYSNQVCNAFFELIDTCANDIKQLEIIINAFCDRIEYNKNKVKSQLV